MLSTQSLREQMNRYADGALKADALEEWLASESWDMRRWAPRGLQHFVEAMQGAFISYSNGDMSADQLRDFLLARRDQLGKAREVTESLEAARAIVVDFIEKAGKHREGIAGSQAFMLTGAVPSA